MDPKGKGMAVNDKEKESLFNEPRDDKPIDSGSSHKKRDGKKRRIKKIIFGDGNQGKVKGLGKIAITSDHSISNVF
jgi:hypothetical protein